VNTAPEFYLVIETVIMTSRFVGGAKQVEMSFFVGITFFSNNLNKFELNCKNKNKNKNNCAWICLV